MMYVLSQVHFFIEDLQNVRGKVEKVIRSLKITVGLNVVFKYADF